MITVYRKENPNQPYPVGAVTLRDDGFLPTGVNSPFRFFAERYGNAEPAGSPLYADCLEVPDLWEIVNYFSGGKITDDGENKAQIVFCPGLRDQIVREVRWLSGSGRVDCVDHYDQYGRKYYSEVRNPEEKAALLIYFGTENRPVLIYQPLLDIYTLFRDGRPCGSFENTESFIGYYVKEAYGEEKFAILSCPPVLRRNRGKALILTNSDRVEHIERLVHNLPETEFHIGARTRMSDRLMNLGALSNVRLYPGLTEKRAEELYRECSFYLDINHYQEIYDAVEKAVKHDLLILGFSETLHRPERVLPFMKFGSSEPEKMEQVLRGLCRDQAVFEEMINRQQAEYVSETVR